MYAKPPKIADESFQRLVGWKRVTLAPGKSQTITVVIDSRVLQIFDETNDRWSFLPGNYEVIVGGASDDTPLVGSLLVS